MRCLVALIALTCLTFPATAEEPVAARKVNFGAVLTDIEGKPFNWDCKKLNETDDKKCEEWRPMTLALLASSALSRNSPATAGTDQIHRALLAQEIYKGGDIALDGKDTTLVCDAIASFVADTKNSTIVTLRAWEIIDPARVKK